MKTCKQLAAEWEYWNCLLYTSVLTSERILDSVLEMFSVKGVENVQIYVPTGDRWNSCQMNPMIHPIPLSLIHIFLNEKNELHNRNLHISGLLNEEKVDIGDAKADIENAKVDIQDQKVDMESVLSEKGSDFSVKTTVHIHRLFEKFGFDEVFGRSAVMELLELKSSGRCV